MLLIALLCTTIIFEATIESSRSTDLTTRPGYQFINTIEELSNSELVPMLMQNEKVAIEFANSQDPLKQRLWRRAAFFEGTGLIQATTMIVERKGALIVFHYVEQMLKKLYLLMALENWYHSAVIQTVSNGLLFSYKRASRELADRTESVMQCLREFGLDQKLGERRADSTFPELIPVAMLKHGFEGNSRVKQVDSLMFANVMIFFRTIAICWTFAFIVVLIETLRFKRRLFRRRKRRQQRPKLERKMIIIPGVVKRVPVFVTVYRRNDIK